MGIGRWIGGVARGRRDQEFVLVSAVPAQEARRRLDAAVVSGTQAWRRAPMMVPDDRVVYGHVGEDGFRLMLLRVRFSRHLRQPSLRGEIVAVPAGCEIRCTPGGSQPGRALLWAGAVAGSLIAVLGVVDTVVPLVHGSFREALIGPVVVGAGAAVALLGAGLTWLARGVNRTDSEFLRSWVAEKVEGSPAR
ncbi:hypothetical protein [Actinoplanes palleronii]|uniref:Uncharacterized protein n=1 Tax=Actinoplanes palleronii TaxID=113570 RepID=A0ABQ4B8Y4_9ACTN|nr:hypothetical protein [Actinoplanes palleronii]GIE67094.1 hypothetical protein Apa02nite_032020 [Actinoplanes palleronii]